MLFFLSFLSILLFGCGKNSTGKTYSPPPVEAYQSPGLEKIKDDHNEEEIEKAVVTKETPTTEDISSPPQPIFTHLKQLVPLKMHLQHDRTTIREEYNQEYGPSLTELNIRKNFISQFSNLAHLCPFNYEQEGFLLYPLSLKMIEALKSNNQSVGIKLQGSVQLKHLDVDSISLGIVDSQGRISKIKELEILEGNIINLDEELNLSTHQIIARSIDQRPSFVLLINDDLFLPSLVTLHKKHEDTPMTMRNIQWDHDLYTRPFLFSYEGADIQLFPNSINFKYYSAPFNRVRKNQRTERQFTIDNVHVGDELKLEIDLYEKKPLPRKRERTIGGFEAIVPANRTRTNPLDIILPEWKPHNRACIETTTYSASNSNWRKSRHSFKLFLNRQEIRPLVRNNKAIFVITATNENIKNGKLSFSFRTSRHQFNARKRKTYKNKGNRLMCLKFGLKKEDRVETVKRNKEFRIHIQSEQSTWTLH